MTHVSIAEFITDIPLGCPTSEKVIIMRKLVNTSEKMTCASVTAFPLGMVYAWRTLQVPNLTLVHL